MRAGAHCRRTTHAHLLRDRSTAIEPQPTRGNRYGCFSGAGRKDIYRAFDQALDRVSKQLRRAKRELRDDKPEGISKAMLLREALIELRGIRDERASRRDRRPQPGLAFQAYMDRLLDGEREASLLFAAEDVGRDLRVPFATALDWVIEYIDDKLGTA